MHEVQLVTWRVPASKVVNPVQDLTALNLGVNQPELVELIGTGWVPTTHSILPFGTTEMLLSVMLTRTAPTVPDSLPTDMR